MAYVYCLHPLATTEYIEAYEWYENKQVGLGERFLKEIKKKIEGIAAHPETYASKGNRLFREAKIEHFPYIIIYKLYKQKQEIFINSVHHAKKHPGKKYRQ